MKLKRGTFAEMADDIISRNDKIVVFGAGVVGMSVTPEILREYGLLDRVVCFIDNDKARWDTSIKVCGKNIKILPPDVLKTFSTNITVLITMSRFFNALEQMSQIEGTKDYACYIITAMCVENFHNNGGKGVIKTSDKPIIPKKIHYMWLGKKTMPDRLVKCIDSWKKYCPDYEIIRWDETNYDIHKNKFVSQAYDNKLYGFVPDYARIEILYDYGGIYLDTDVELKKNLDKFLYQEAFCSVEKWQVINFGGGSGAVKGHKALELFLESWERRSLVRDDGTFDHISSGMIDTTVAINAGYMINGKNQTVRGLNIYTYDYFHPYDYMTGKVETTDDTYAIHHFNGGWLDEDMKLENEKIQSEYRRIEGLSRK